MSDVIRHYRGMTKNLLWVPGDKSSKGHNAGPMQPYPSDPPTPSPPKIEGVPTVPGQSPTENKRFKLA